MIGKLVLICIDKGKAIEDMTISELKEIDDTFEPDIYDAITLKTCVEKRETIGAPGHKPMAQVIKIEREYLESDWKDNNIY